MDILNIENVAALDYGIYDWWELFSSVIEHATAHRKVPLLLQKITLG
jgi:hypothetical protein